MCSLLEEYRRRHGIESVWPMNEGLLFLNRDNAPLAIVLTSSYTKCYRSCKACQANSDGITLEILIQDIYPGCFGYLSHLHMRPDGDVLDYVNKLLNASSPVVPYIAKGERDQERWLWEFFLGTNPFRVISSVGRSRWKRLLANQEKSKMPPDQALVEQASWFMTHHPEGFRSFYNSLYSACMIGRKYILIG